LLLQNVTFGRDYEAFLVSQGDFIALFKSATVVNSQGILALASVAPASGGW
jgi:hypothetical protein